MKICIKCGQPKVDADFGSNRSICLNCKRSYNNNYYQENKSKITPSKKANGIRRLKLIRSNLLKYLKSNPCIICKETDPIVLDFDHLGGKSYNVSDMVRAGHSWDSILIEISKCQVLCSNCHRRKTAMENGYYKCLYQGLA